MSGKESDAVLAFLLGSMSSLDAPEHGNTVSRDEVEGVDDLPPREPVSDSDVEPHTAVSATADASSSSDLDTITSEVTSCESEDDGNSADTPHPEAIEQEICMKDPESKNSMEGKNAHIAEAEHEDDCADPNREKKSSKAVVKGRPESTGNRAVAKSKGRLTETKKKRNNNVATVLVAYLLACVYSFFHPVVFPLPNYEELFSAYDISNVSVHILTTNKKDVYVRKPPTPSIEDEVHLSSPLDGAIFERHQSIVLEYTALLIDDDIYLKKTHVDDGNMLLRGLGVGPHTLEAKAVNDQNKVTASISISGE
ncbi:hypothetical protein PInf_028976 [Phytophthora infestans]|nr:hypothetical protein PInf_028976 [Phytophthora infestans]